MTSLSKHVVYEMSGLSISSEVVLSARPGRRGLDATAADLTITIEKPRDQPYRRPSADVVAEHGVDGFTWYSICRVGETFVIRMPGIGDFEIDPDLRAIRCFPTHEPRAEYLPIVLTGTVLSFVLEMRGLTVLHGSAVDIGGSSLAFVGASGQGKSTMAAIMCASGAPLVTDDVLPIFFKGDTPVPWCLRSGHEIRLREKSASLTQSFREGTSIRVTADERHAVTPAAADTDQLPLKTIVIPRPIHEISAVSARRLGVGEAALQLSRFDRIEGWRDRAHLRRQFLDVGRIVDLVPVFEVSVPWGPPFAPELALDILRSCDLELPLLS